MVKARCPHFSVCGGCQQQKISYPTQVQLKAVKLSKLFGRDVEVMPNPLPFRYRNRMDFSVSGDAIGLRASGGHQVFDVHECHLVSEEMQQLFLQVKDWLQKNTLHETISYLTVREGQGLQLVITSSAQVDQSLLDDLSQELDIASLIAQLSTNDSTSGQVYFTSGQDLLDIKVGSTVFSTSHETFFQASTQIFEQALVRIDEFCTGSTLDLYSGVGAITLNISSERVVGVESNKLAVELARQNAQRSNSPVEFIHADAARYLIDERFDTIIVDPPRTGLKQAALQILAAKPQRIIYLSCDPTTQRRDLIQLRRDYSIVHIECFDFFPQTDHVESLMILDRRV